MFEAGKEYLRKARLESQVSNTLLFFGSDLSYLKESALELSAFLLQCPIERLLSNKHPDFHTIIPEGKSALHSIESIRGAIENSHTSSFEAPTKIFLIESAERMQPAAANALLKTLEEPTLDSYWLLLSCKPQEILPTILSRCTQLSFSSREQVASPNGEEVQLLRSLLRERPSYPKLFAGLETIEKLLEKEESQTKALGLFTEIARYFGEEEKKGVLSGQERSYPWEEPLEEALVAFQRNIKLSACLEVFFFRAFSSG